MNLVLQFFETTTTAFMGANQEQRMMYPVMVMLRLTPGGPVIKGGVIFISEDLQHDFQQVLVRNVCLLLLWDINAWC